MIFAYLPNCLDSEKMALRQPGRRLLERTTISKFATSYVPPWQERKNFATETRAPSVTQDATGLKGPTAIVFMNMGGPSTTEEVGDFLSRLFVCTYLLLVFPTINHLYLG